MISAKLIEFAFLCGCVPCGVLILPQAEPKLLHLNVFHIKVMASTMFSLVFNNITKLAKHCLTLGLGSSPKESCYQNYLNLQHLMDKIMLFMAIEISK